MESVRIRELRKLAEAYDANLGSDERFQREVSLIHEDGSITHYANAFLMHHDGYIIAFTEHYGIHIVHENDLLLYWQSERVNKTIERLPCI